MESHSQNSEIATKVNGSIGSILMGDVPGFNKVIPTKNEGTPFEDQIRNLNEARQQLEDLRSADIDTELKAAKEKGYADGFKQGVAEGINKSISDNSNSLNTINNIVDNLSSLISNESNKVSPIISDAIATALKNSFFIQSKIDKGAVSKIVESGLNVLPSFAEDISIFCSPDDFALLTTNDTIKNRIVIDSDLTSGEIYINSSVGNVKLTGESISRKISNNILESLKNE